MANSPNPLHVAVGVIQNSQQQYLVAKRPKHVDQGDLWEFPGGKVEPNESVYAALCRELHEELGIVVQQAQPLIKVTHSYPSITVLLDTYLITQYQGEPHGVEGQPLRWVDYATLMTLSMPAASAEILGALMALHNA